MLDSSCGSMHWMPLVLQEHEKKQKDFKFMGTDVVCSLIDQHKVTFVNHTNWQFQVGGTVICAPTAFVLQPSCMLVASVVSDSQA